MSYNCICEDEAEERSKPVGSADGEIVDPFCNPNKPIKIPFEKVALAYVLLREGIVRTKCAKSHLSLISGMNVYLKNEFTQFTGSFKERGARFTMLSLDEASKKKGLVAASAGNHAQAMAYHGLLLGIPITVVMPEIAPLMKIQKCRDLKANVIIDGKDLSESKAIAMKYARDNNAIYINGFDHPDVIAGQGTTGIEILEQVPDVAAVVIPCGGGSLVSGVSLAIKTLKPSVKIIGVESCACAGFAAAMEAGKPVQVKPTSTIADGLAVAMVGYNSVYTAKDYVDRMVQVKEEDIAVAMLRLVEMEKYIIEGAGAVGVAALLSGQLDEFTGKDIVIILSGGNVDTTVLSRVLDRGLAADARLVKLYVKISDRPGSLADLCAIVASTGAVIRRIAPERAFVKLDVFRTEMKLLLETRNFEHAKELEKVIGDNYKDFTLECVDFPASSSTKQRYKIPIFN